MKFPVGLQLYSVREDLASDFESTLKKLSEMGYDGVEFAGLFGNSPETVKALCEKYSLTPISAHVSFEELVNNIDKVIGDHKTIGCKFIVISYMAPENRPGVENYDEVVAKINEIGRKLSENGFTLLYHNHDFEFVKIDGEYGLDVLYNSVSDSVLKAELDTCWIAVGGEDPAGYVRKYSSRTPIVHLKDYDPGDGSIKNVKKTVAPDDSEKQNEGENTGFSFRPVGYGVQDFKGILAACADSGAQWVIVEQDEPSLKKTPLECAKMSIDYLSTIN